MSDINQISPGIRDSLLLHNLAFSDSIYHYVNHASGIGLPVQFTNQYGLNQNIPLQQTGTNVLNTIGLYNKYIPNEYELKTIEFTQNNNSTIMGGYYSNGRLNGYGDNVDFISGVIQGTSILDIQNRSLASVLLSSTDVINDTDLAKIGNKQLFEHLKYRTIQNAYQSTVGRVNVNIFSLLNGGDFLKRDYEITKPKTLLGNIGDVALELLGLYNPFAEMSDDVSIYTYENAYKGQSLINTIERNNKFIIETGGGQRSLLELNLRNNLNPTFNGGGVRYSPNYLINDEIIGLNKDVNGEYDDRYINYIDGEVVRTNNRNTINRYGENEITYDVRSVDSENFVKISDEINFEDEFSTPQQNDFSIEFTTDKKSLLDKTTDLFNKDKIKTIINNKGSNNVSDESLVSIHANSDRNFSGTSISKGSQVIYLEKLTSTESESNPNNYFCRSWVSNYGYDRVSRLQKNRGLDGQIGRREGIDGSVLDTNGFVRMSPYIGSDVKKFMFSLENLAWANNIINLPEWEIGPGDLMTGTKGRIMWFPPYDLKFSESVGVNLDTHFFIGRGEPMYTYNNTERSGQLSFKVIMDHPQYMNDKSIKNFYGEELYEDVIQSLIAGCGDLSILGDNPLSQIEKNALEVINSIPEEVIDLANEIPPEPFDIYFPNDVATIGLPEDIDGLDDWIEDLFANPTGDITKDVAWPLYEIKGSTSSPYTTPWINSRTEGYTAGTTTDTNGTYKDRLNYGLNKWKSTSFLNELKDILENKCKTCKVYISGYASKDGKPDSNKSLSEDRAKNIANFLRNTVLKNDVVDESVRFGSSNETVVGKGETGVDSNSDRDHIEKKRARTVRVSFEPNLEIKQELEKNPKIEENKKIIEEFAMELSKRFFNEAEYFKRLSQVDPVFYHKITEKIKYFSPAFHSITPEGFNSRLTFLHQCTRQGATTHESSQRPNNMVFGMPPVCILRIGDFYNTKIMIESLNIDYEENWDLNPEGVGVQPMIANVSISFKFLGGSSLEGPISQLQNAVAFNYYANTQIFDPRANYYSRFESNTQDDEDQGGVTEKYKYVNGLRNLGQILKMNE